MTFIKTAFNTALKICDTQHNDTQHTSNKNYYTECDHGNQYNDTQHTNQKSNIVINIMLNVILVSVAFEPILLCHFF